MKRIIIISLFLAIGGPMAFGQTIDSLKLTDAEIPAGYSKSDQLICVTPHGCSFYDQSDMYESFIGKVVKKTFQSFSKKGDKGSILYLEFDEEFKGAGFLNGLLWGEETKPTKSEPDEYYAKGKVLVIWSFKLDSELKAISKAKVERLLQ
jgi:hypothetical protein